MGARRKIAKYDEDDDEREKLLRTIPPGNVRARGVHGSESGILELPNVYKSRWRSIRVMYLTMFLSSVSFSICMSSLYPYLKVLDPSATTDFLGWVVASYSVGQLVASPFFGAWSNWRKKTREPIIFSLTINTFANVLYMYLESLSHHRAAFLVVARAFVGFGAGNVAVVRSYVSGATTLNERTPAMANMSACQAVGFIIGPVIQTAMVPIGFPGPIHSPGFHLDMYTATALFSAVVGGINIILLIIVFKEHKIPERELIPDIQGSAADTVEEVEETSLDYPAVLSSIVLFFFVLFIFSVFETISTPLAMHMFAWTKSAATLWIGVLLGCAGIVSIVVFVCIRILSKRFNERYLLFGGFLICLCGFIIYLPWGSHYPSIQYADFSPVTTTTAKTTSFSTFHTDLTDYPSSIQFGSSSKITNLAKRGHILSNFRLYDTKVSIKEIPPVTERVITNNYTESTESRSVRTTNQPTTNPETSTPLTSLETTEGGSSTMVVQTTSQKTMTTHTNTYTTESSSRPTETTAHSSRSTQEVTTSPETTLVHTSTHTTESSTRPPSEQTSHETSTRPVQTTEPTEHTTFESPTTELVPNITTTAAHTENTTSEAVGCPYLYKWCYYTPAILLWQFLLGTLFIAVGYPTCNVMSYALYSKILGPKPQGLWMGWLTAAGSLARCLGPVFVSQVYDAYGPRVTFISMCGLVVLTIAGFLAVCKRLVPFRSVISVRV